MAAFRGFLRFLPNSSHRVTRRSRAAYLEITPLETRALQTIIPSKSVVLVHPALLPATDGKFLPVHIYGSLATTRSTTPQGFFFVTDEYRAVEPHGNLLLTPVGIKDGFYHYTFDFNLFLQAKRSTNTPDGRHYYAFIGAKDRDDTDGRTVGIFVPKTLPKPSHPR